MSYDSQGRVIHHWDALIVAQLDNTGDAIEPLGSATGVVKLSRATATCCGVRLPREYYRLWFGAST
jgi:hypothetical protein